MKPKKQKSMPVKNVSTYLVYIPNKHFFISRYFLEHFYFKYFKKNHRFLIVTTKNNFPALGFQQILHIKKNDSPELIQKLISDRLYNQNLYSFRRPQKNSPLSLLITLMLFSLLLLLFLNIPKNNPTVSTVTNVPTPLLKLDLLTSTSQILGVTYRLTLDVSTTSLELTFDLDKHLSPIFQFQLPDSFVLQQLYVDDKPLSSQYFALRKNTLTIDLTPFKSKSASVKVVLDSTQKPQQINIVSPTDNQLDRHILEIAYPPKTQLSLDSEPVFAQPGLLRYNVPQGDFILNLQYDQTHL